MNQKEALATYNPFRIKFGIAHFRVGTKFRVWVDTNSNLNERIFVAKRFLVNGYHSYLIETTTPDNALEGENIRIHISHVIQIVETGEGARALDILKPSHPMTDSIHFEIHSDIVKESVAVNRELGHPNSKRMSTKCFGPYVSVLVYLAPMQINDFNKRVDIDSLMRDKELNQIVKTYRTGEDEDSIYETVLSWNPKKLKKWVKKNALRHLWNREKESVFQSNWKNG